jgi:hypothetical protein
MNKANFAFAIAILACMSMVVVVPDAAASCSWTLDCHDCGDFTDYGACTPKAGCENYSCHNGDCGNPVACLFLCDNGNSYYAVYYYCN